MTEFFTEKYDLIFNELADHRVKEWTGLTSPVTPFLIVISYLLSVYALLPAYMLNRKPYSLKTTLLFYNVFQIVSCGLIIWGMSTSGWTTTYSWGCQTIDYSNNPQALRMLDWCYYTHILKGIELVETFMFILRKKYNQVTTLHVYHHASTFFISWVGVKYVGGGMATFPVLINSLIHVLMYIYYLLASLGEEWQEKTKHFKRPLTIMQIIQLGIIIAHSLQALHPDCHVPKQFLFMYVPNVGLLLYMFLQFYRQSYHTRKTSED